MSFGLRTWGGDGVIQMDTDTFTYQVIHNKTYQFSSGVTHGVTIPGFSPSTCVAALLPTGRAGGVGYDTMPFMYVGAGGVTMYAYHPLNTAVPSRLEVRLIVMRYK